MTQTERPVTWQDQRAARALELPWATSYDAVGDVTGGGPIPARGTTTVELAPGGMVQIALAGHRGVNLRIITPDTDLVVDRATADQLPVRGTAAVTGERGPDA